MTLGYQAQSMTAIFQTIIAIATTASNKPDRWLLFARANPIVNTIINEGVQQTATATFKATLDHDTGAQRPVDKRWPRRLIHSSLLSSLARYALIP